MNSFKKGLDKYLTSEPFDGFDNWCEMVTENLNDAFFEKNENWVLECDGIMNKWLNKLFYKEDLTIAKSAELIQRAHKLYKL